MVLPGVAHSNVIVLELQGAGMDASGFWMIIGNTNA